MDDEARLAQTEAAFREVNEVIATTAARFQASETEFVCECADPDCAHRMTAELDDYEQVRSEPTHFLIAPGHDKPQIERVVERRSEYDVVEKFGPVAARIVRQLDPRTA